MKDIQSIQNSIEETIGSLIVDLEHQGEILIRDLHYLSHSLNRASFRASNNNDIFDINKTKNEGNIFLENRIVQWRRRERERKANSSRSEDCSSGGSR